MKSMKQIGYGVLVATLAAPVSVFAQTNGFGTVPGTGSSYSSVASSSGMTQNSIGQILTTVMNWVLEEVAGKVLAQVPPTEVEWVEADELWTYVGKKRSLLAVVGC